MKNLIGSLMLTGLLMISGVGTAEAQDRDFQRIPEGAVVVQEDRLDHGTLAQLREDSAVVAEVDSTSYLVSAGSVVSIRNDLAQLDRLSKLDSLRKVQAAADDSVIASLDRRISALQGEVDFYQNWQDRAVEVIKDQQRSEFWETAENVLWGAAGYGVCEAVSGTR